jgi:hypothetical protein
MVFGGIMDTIEDFSQVSSVKLAHTTFWVASTVGSCLAKHYGPSDQYLAISTRKNVAKAYKEKGLAPEIK